MLSIIKKRDDFARLLNHLKCRTGAEIGVQKGDFASIIRKTWNGEYHLIDHWKFDPCYDDASNVSDEKQQELYLSVVQKFLPDRSVYIYRRNSLDAARSFPDSYFDWIYIDANHSYDGCRKDLLAWWPKLKSGGLFSGHDFVDGPVFQGQVWENPASFGVKSAVKEFLSGIDPDRKIKLYLTEDYYPSWYFRKP
jgi:hypothetical protein